MSPSSGCSFSHPPLPVLYRSTPSSSVSLLGSLEFLKCDVSFRTGAQALVRSSNVESNGNDANGGERASSEILHSLERILSSILALLDKSIVISDHVLDLLSPILIVVQHLIFFGLCPGKEERGITTRSQAYPTNILVLKGVAEMGVQVGIFMDLGLFLLGNPKISLRPSICPVLPPKTKSRYMGYKARLPKWRM